MRKLEEKTTKELSTKTDWNNVFNMDAKNGRDMGMMGEYRK